MRRCRAKPAASLPQACKASGRRAALPSPATCNKPPQPDFLALCASLSSLKRLKHCALVLPGTRAATWAHIVGAAWVGGLSIGAVEEARWAAHEASAGITPAPALRPALHTSATQQKQPKPTDLAPAVLGILAHLLERLDERKLLLLAPLAAGRRHNRGRRRCTRACCRACSGGCCCCAGLEQLGCVALEVDLWGRWGNNTSFHLMRGGEVRSDGAMERGGLARLEFVQRSHLADERGRCAGQLQLGHQPPPVVPASTTKPSPPVHR